MPVQYKASKVVLIEVSNDDGSVGSLPSDPEGVVKKLREFMSLNEIWPRERGGSSGPTHHVALYDQEDTDKIVAFLKGLGVTRKRPEGWLIKEAKPPTDLGWVTSLLVSDVLDLLDKKKSNLEYGPFVVVVSEEWEAYMDKLYQPLVYGDKTVGQRIGELSGIKSVEWSTDLDGFEIALVSFK